MKRRSLTLVFNHFEREHFGKDVFLVPYYLGKYNDCNVTIVYPKTETNKEFPVEMNGVKLFPLELRGGVNSFWLYRYLNFVVYLLNNARNIDVLMRFHYGTVSVLYVVLYKLLNKGGISYLKIDGVVDIPQKLEACKVRTLKSLFQKMIYVMFSNKVDIVSCETLALFEKMSHSKSSFMNLNKKLVYMPNGFDEEYLNQLHIKERSFEEKENIIITVGRLGTVQKNTELFLEALAKLDLKSWKVYFIGSIEESFKMKIAEFYRLNPNKKESVYFEGVITEKNILWEYYNRSKVFVLTSRWEGFPIVYTEAKRFKNYIVTTPVLAYRDVLEEEQYGAVVSCEDSNSLINVLSEIVDGYRNINVYNGFDSSQLSWKELIQAVVI